MTKKQIITASATAALLLASATLAFAQTASTATTATTAATPTIATPVPTPTPPTPSGVGAPTGTPTVPSEERVGAAPIPMPMRKDAKNTVQIGPEGNALIHGTVNAVGTNSITVNSWGGLWTVVIDSGTEIMPKSTTTPLGAIKQGDFVGVNGKIDTTQAWTVNARVVRDTDAQQRMAMTQKQMRMQMKDAQEKARQNIQQIKKTGKEEIKNLRQKQEEERKKLKGQ